MFGGKDAVNEYIDHALMPSAEVFFQPAVDSHRIMATRMW